MCHIRAVCRNLYNSYTLCKLCKDWCCRCKWYSSCFWYCKADGDWGTAPGGKTLVGELGREIVVDPHTGRWYTVGDNGAEFRDIPAGAIVFNHVQSESLLENGYVAGRAAALVSGTALVTGGYKPYNQVHLHPQRIFL